MSYPPQGSITKAELNSVEADLATHEVATTAIHGVGASVIDSVAVRNTAINNHSAISDVHHSKFNILDKFREVIDWSSLDAYQTGGDTGHDNRADGSSVRLKTGVTSGYVARIASINFWQRFLDTGKAITIEFPIPEIQYNEADTYFWLRFAMSVSAEGEVPSETVDHFGWKMMGGDLYASNADGSTQKITDTGVHLDDGTQRTRLKVVLTPGTDCKFYVNDVLKVTHTENLPDYLHYYLHFVVQTKTSASRFIRVGRVLIEKEHA